MWRMGWTKLATWSRRLSQCRPSPVSTLLLAGWGRPIWVLSEQGKPSQSKAAVEVGCAMARCMQSRKRKIGLLHTCHLLHHADYRTSRKGKLYDIDRGRFAGQNSETCLLLYPD